MAIRKKIALLLGASMLVGIAQAETLLIDEIQQSQQTATSRPTRGMTMQRVEMIYGSPTAREPAVGDPPITRWEYPAFTVYFEYDKVIHAVVNR